MKEEYIDREFCKDEKKQTKKKGENQLSICSRNGEQSRKLLPLKPKRPGSTAPADIRIILLRVVGEFRKKLMERDNRVGKEVKHVLNLKNDEEFIDKILSMSDAEKLKDLHRLVDGRGYNWKEFQKNNVSVSKSDEVGVYLGAAPLNNSEQVKLAYVGYTNSSLESRYRAHRYHPIKIIDDETGVIIVNNFHYTALLGTTRSKLKEDKFIQSLQDGLDMRQVNKKRKIHKTAEEESISYFLKTVEAIFIGLFFTCQTCQWFNIRMQNCMPYATNVVKGLNMRPSLAHGEIPLFSVYNQTPRPEEEDDTFKSMKFPQILTMVSRGIKELKRKSIMGTNPSKKRTKRLGKILSNL